MDLLDQYGDDDEEEDIKPALPPPFATNDDSTNSTKKVIKILPKVGGSSKNAEIDVDAEEAELLKKRKLASSPPRGSNPLSFLSMLPAPKHSKPMSASTFNLDLKKKNQEEPASTAASSSNNNNNVTKVATTAPLNYSFDYENDDNQQSEEQQQQMQDYEQYCQQYYAQQQAEEEQNQHLLELQTALENAPVEFRRERMRAFQQGNIHFTEVKQGPLRTEEEILREKTDPNFAQQKPVANLGPQATSRLGKRKSQLGYLAFQSQQMQLELQQKNMEKRKNQTILRSRYGW